MIHVKEINTLAGKNRLRDTQVEKDYIASWILYGISKNDFLSANLVFKGSTLLKKVYFPEYRFSEDLAFTLLRTETSNEQLIKEFSKIAAFIKEEANITLQLTQAKDLISGSLSLYMTYIGPLQGIKKTRDIKVDINRGEVLEFPLENVPMIILYTDLPSESFSLCCYSLPEVLTEKMVCLMKRTEPRDLYDLWYLTVVEGLKVSNYTVEFERKAVSRGLNPFLFKESVQKKEKNLSRAWNRKLEHQMHDLPDFDEVFWECREDLS